MWPLAVVVCGLAERLACKPEGWETERAFRGAQAQLWPSAVKKDGLNYSAEVSHLPASASSCRWQIFSDWHQIWPLLLTTGKYFGKQSIGRLIPNGKSTSLCLNQHKKTFYNHCKILNGVSIAAFNIKIN